jgi:hypothetical protein
VPAVPEPLGRHPAVRPGRQAVRQWRRGRELQQRRLRPVRGVLRRRSGQPVRRPAGAGRDGAQRPDRRGRRATQPERPAHRRPGHAGRWDPSGRPGHRPGPAGQPLRVLRRRQRPADRRLRAAQPVPVHPAAGDRRAVRHSRVGGATLVRLPPRPVRGELRGLPHGQFLDHRAGLLPGRVLPGGLQRRAVLRRLQPQRDLGHAPRHQRPARPRQDPVLRRHRRGRWGRSPGGPEGRPRRRPVLRRHGGRQRPPHHLQRRQPTAHSPHRRHPHERQRPADGAL